MNATLPALPPGIGTLTDAQARMLDDRYPEAMATLSNCITCLGRKTFRWYAPGSVTEVVTYDCDCRGQYRLWRWLWNAGVMPKYQRLGFRDLTRTSFVGGEIYADYVANNHDYVRGGYGLVFHGPRGTGKTLIAHLAIKELLGDGLDCYVTTFEDMVDAFAAGWTDKDQARWFNRRVRDCKVLLIDDLGRERNKGSGTVGETMLESVIRHRVACQMPTFITTNLDPTADLGSMYGGHTISLLSECSFYCEVDGLDSRREINARGADEYKRRLTRPVTLG